MQKNSYQDRHLVPSFSVEGTNWRRGNHLYTEN